MKKLALLVLVVLAFGCGGSGFNFDNGPLVRMVNAYGGTEVFGSVGGTTVINGTGFATAGVQRLLAGSQNAVFTNKANNAVLANVPVTLQDKKEYTIIGSPSGIQVLQESFTPTAGNAAVRVSNAAGALAPTVDVLTGPTVGTATVLRDDLATGSATPFSNLAAGTQHWIITNQDRSTVLYEGDVTLTDGKHYTFIIGAQGTVHFITLTED